VIGVPLPSSEMNGIDSLHAIVQMPPGIPVGCVAIGSWGAMNAAHLAAQIVGLTDTAVEAKIDAYRDKLHNA
jgi:5-(carboxyamino)imidazole ribonucleotide mutase